MLEADSILKALGVEAEEDIQNLLQYFFREEDGDASDDEDEAIAMLQVNGFSFLQRGKKEMFLKWVSCHISFGLILKSHYKFLSIPLTHTCVLTH